MSRDRSRPRLFLGAAKVRYRLARGLLPAARAGVGVDLKDAALVLGPLDDALGDPSLKRALRVAHRNHLRHEASAVGDVDGVAAFYQVDVDAGVLPELPDADPLLRQVRRGVVHGIARVPQVRIEGLAALPVTLLCHAATVAHDCYSAPAFRNALSPGMGATTGWPVPACRGAQGSCRRARLLNGGTMVTITPRSGA